MYLDFILNKYNPRSLTKYQNRIWHLKYDLENWAGTCFIEILKSGSIAKGTAISLASDADYLISLSSGCNSNSGGLRSIYDSLYNFLKKNHFPVRKQNVSFGIKIGDLDVDITPARKHKGHTNDHWLYVSKLDTWKQTNIQKHINDVSNSGRQNEIKLLKIWREINKIDFPSIYLEYLTIDILCGKSKDKSRLSNNFVFVLEELSKEFYNPLDRRIVDPANSTNILSDLLTYSEKNRIKQAAQSAVSKAYLSLVVY